MSGRQPSPLLVNHVIGISWRCGLEGDEGSLASVGSRVSGSYAGGIAVYVRLYSCRSLYVSVVARSPEVAFQEVSFSRRCLRVVSSENFAELMSVIAAYTEAKPVHVALRNVASDRQDELVSCKKFVRILGCKYILEQPSLDQEAASDLRAAKQLALHGATMFRIANRMKTVTTVEKNKPVRMYQEVLQKIEQLRLQVDSQSSTIDPDEQAHDDAEKENIVRMYHAAPEEIDQLRSQVNKDSSTLVLDEQAHNDAKLALQASESAANQARDELDKAEERAVRTAQAMQKMKLELEVFRNAEHNNKYNLEKANKEIASLRLALEGSEKSRNAEVASLTAVLEASQLQAVNEQRKAAEAQRATAQQARMSAELAAARKQAERAEEDQRGAARGVNRVKDEFFASQARLAKTKQELVAATASLVATRLNNFTLQRSIYDLQYLILNDAENRQLLLQCGPPTFVPQ